jgi:LmbE family N-acetylglucosaminyl deacetylase
VRRLLGLTLFLSIGAAGVGLAQLAPAGTGGVAALAGTLRQLGSNKRVLMIGAHPDDEDTQLLVLLSRGLGAQAAYLSLTRGEGGQNLIGPELGPELGIIRTEELLAARELDGARQFFTRAYDFGFSKSAEETFRFWPRDSILKDVVDVIRRFRPQIIVAVFSGTPADGHGQHQVSGMIARQAFDLLRDSAGGPVKFYRSTRFDTAATTVTLPVGTLDPMLGQSYFQVAMASRSRHRSQDMGQLQRPGPATARIGLITSKTPASESALFAGVDTAMRAPGYAALIDSARAALTPWRLGATLPYLIRALRSLGSADAEQRSLLERAIAIAGGVSIDGTADDGIVTPGQRLQVEVNVWNAGDSTVRVDSIAVVAPPGWTLDRPEPGAPSVAPGSLQTRRFVLNVGRDAERTQPYFLRRPRVNRGGLYDWSGAPPDVRGLPFEPPPVIARVRLTIGGEPVTLTREVVYRYRDQAIGEIRRPIFVTRDVDVAIAPEELLWPIDGASREPRRFTITATNRSRGAAAAAGRVTVPAGWPPIPAESLSFTREDESKSVVLSVAPPTADALRPGTYELRAGTGWLEIIDYPHIRPRALSRPSTAQIRAARVLLPGLTRIGYVRGAADRVPEALAAVGLPLELIGPDSLARGDLSRYDAIVIGSRAYETEPALVANNGRLLEYGRNGGLIIVQYQQYPFVDGGFAPYPLTMARPHDRVTDENAPVTPIDSTHPVFHYPNDIGAQDWRGWVQERGLYFARSWDTTYVPVLETHDPTPTMALKGGLLIAPLGRGTYVYTGLSFFRQLPAGVPGAYRLFVNLLGLQRRNAIGCWSWDFSWSPDVPVITGFRSLSTVPTVVISSPCSKTVSKRCTPTSMCVGSTWGRRTCTTACAPSARIPRRTSGSAAPRSSWRRRRAIRCSTARGHPGPTPSRSADGARAIAISPRTRRPPSFSTPNASSRRPRLRRTGTTCSIQSGKAS